MAESSFLNVRITKRSRIGILDIIQRFKILAKNSTEIFGSAERRMDLDKWLEKLADSVIEGIQNTSDSTNSKYPAPVVRFENLHQFYCKFFFNFLKFIFIVRLGLSLS